VYTKSAFIDPMYGYVDDNGHGPNPQTMAYLHGWHSGLLKGVADALSGIKEGDKTAFDNAAIVHCGENGEAHHSDHVRWPVAIYGDAGGALKADGRYLRFAKKGGSGARSLADVYATIGAAFGVANPDDFAKGGPEARQGVVHEMLA
jgi:hypothetical protein